MTGKGRYLAGQKNTDAQVERILLGYAQGLTAAEFIRASKATMQAPPASKTVYRIYRLVRKRLAQISFPPAEIWLHVAQDETQGEGNNPIRSFYLNLGMESKIRAEIARRRGLTAGNWDEMMGEFVFRSLYGLRPQVFLRYITRMVRITGRLNEPIQNRSLWTLESDIMGCQFQIEYGRSVLFPGNAKEMISMSSFYEQHIEYVRWKVRREQRRLKRLRAQPGFDEDAVPPPPDRGRVMTREQVAAAIASIERAQTTGVNDGHA